MTHPAFSKVRTVQQFVDELLDRSLPILLLLELVELFL